MKKTQKSDVNMMDATKAFISSPAAATLLALPSFATFNSSFNSILNQIFANMESQGLNRKGFRTTKISIRKDLTAFSVAYAAKLMSYATVINDMVLFNQMDIKKSDLDRVSELEVIPIVQSIIDALTAHLAALVVYNVDAAALANYIALLESYKVARPKTRLGIADKKDATKKLALLIALAKQSLANLDGVVKTIILANPELVNNYLNIRKITDFPTTKLSARVSIVDPDGQALPFVNVKCLELDMDRKSTVNGTFNLINTAPGKHLFELSTPGYKTSKVSIIINDGQRKELTFTLNPEE